MAQLGPTPLNISSENKVKLFMDVEVTMIDPEMIPAVLREMTFA